jgi:hypothetical protein
MPNSGTHIALGPFVLGVDLSSHCIDFAKVDENHNQVIWSRCHLDGKTAWDRTLTIGNLRADGLTFDDVYLVAIEAPYGRGQAGTQAILNRVVGAVAAVLPPRLRTPSTCWIVRPDEWKNGLGLKVKPTAQNVARFLEPVNPWEQIPDDQNARDAACLALWARDVNAQGIAAALNPPTERTAA